VTWPEVALPEQGETTMSDCATHEERAWFVDEALPRLGFGSKSTFYAEVRAGRLEARKIGTGGRGSRTVVLQSEIERYLRSLAKAEL
jgi:hypothetical protein